MIALNGGHYYFDRTIVNYGIPYHVLNDILIGKYGSHSRMTLDPGVIFAFATGKQLQIGFSSNGGEFYAIGTSVSPIIIRAYSNTPGGWEGIYFHANSDEWGSTSAMEYCTVRHGNAYNIYLESTSQPSLTNCTIRNSASHGLVVYQSNPPVHNCSFISNAGYPIKYEDWTCNLHLQGNTYTTNGLNYIALSGGDYSQNRTLYNDGIPYHVLGDIRIILYGSYSRITFTPGITLAFNPGLKIQVGQPSHGGSLWAVGKADSVITFKPYNNAVGGWQGIYFHDGNDNWGGTSPMTYCIIEKGASYNILTEYSTQPTLTNCTIRQSGGHGMVETESNPTIQNCLFQNNNGYPLKYNDWICNSYIKGNTYTGNLNQYIAHPGGDITSNRTLYNDGLPYHITGNIRVYIYGSHNRLTVRPGNTLVFDSAVSIQLGASASYGGDLWAEGKADSLITFRPISNTAGDWGGIHFTDWNDNWGGSSLLKYCIIENGNIHNIRVDNSAQPVIENCRITGSTGDGIRVTGNSSLIIRSTTVTGNATNGILFEGTSSATIGNTSAYTCSIYNNGGYEINNNSTGTTNARYNYLGSTDSTMIMLQHVYDRFDDPTKGIVYIGPFAHLPALTTPTTVMNGYVKYANSGANPMKNAAMAIKDFSGVTIASATTNTSGVYAFSAFASGNYKLTITPSNAWAGVNSTDALLIMQHFAQVLPLSGINLAAADVNGSHSINGTDALFVMKRYSGMISSFPSGDYLHHTENIAVAGNTITQNFQMLCFGDVNASYAPAKKSSGSVGLVYEGSLALAPFTEFSVPVRMKTGMEVGAISLGFHYPEEYLEITGAELVNGVADFSWSAADGLFRMGWCNLAPLSVTDDGVVVVLKMKAKDLSGLSSAILLDLFDESEFADGSAIVNSTMLSIPVLESSLTGIEPEGRQTTLSVYPNPAINNTLLTLTLSSATLVTIHVLDQTGREVMQLPAGAYESGRYSISLDVSTLAAGLYFIKAELKDDEEVSVVTKKLVINR
jgi:parallel beta-helix repeat protein